MSGEPLSYVSLSDEELVGLCSMGDTLAMTTLTKRFFKLTSKFTSAGYLDRDDLLQEGMLGFLYAVKNYSPERGVPFAAYARICMNSHINTVIQRIEKGNAPADESDISEKDAGINIAEAVETTDFLKSVLDMCEEKLSEVEKNVLYYKIIGFSYKETSQKLGISEKAVENALGRARKKLKSERA